tara:strand:- start:4440 stop:4916 length:477 start_codon:yes stop_codon:yes gene_type:complete
MIEAKIHKILFGPDDDIESFILNEIDLAKKNITMLVFWFTWRPIADKLNEAAKRGVDVRMILDSRSTEIKMKDVHPTKETLIPNYLNDCKVYIYDGELLHHKTILIDDDIVLTGTCNFFNASINRHEENYMLIKSKELKKCFEQRYDLLLQKSKEWRQ